MTNSSEKSSASDFSAFLEDRFEASKQYAQSVSEIGKDDLLKAWVNHWNEFWKKCEREFPNLSTLEIESLIVTSQFDFGKTKEYANGLPDNIKRLEFFLEAKAFFDQRTARGFIRRNNLNSEIFRYGECCQIEIDKLEKLIAVSKNVVKKPETRDGKQAKRELATLILDYLFRYAEASQVQIRRQEAIEALTGFSEKQIGDSYRTLKTEKQKARELQEIDEGFYDLMQKARIYFVRLDVQEIVTMIDKDLEGAD